MFELQLLLQRRRKFLARFLLVALLGTAATLAILPRADAKVPKLAPPADVSLLSPDPVAGPSFSRLYRPTPQGTISL
jgi:hypothetical protein